MEKHPVEYGVIFHNTCPRTRESEIVLERIRQRFRLAQNNLTLLSQEEPVVVKRLEHRGVALKLQDVLSTLGAVAWVQELSSGESFKDRRQDRRRVLADRRSAYRHTLSVPERRFGGGRRRSDFGIGGRENWRGLVV